jgi:N utilization substance protein B
VRANWRCRACTNGCSTATTRAWSRRTCRTRKASTRREEATLTEAFTPFLDRPVAELSPVERAALLVGAYELVHCVDIPYKVVINEAVELAKTFGGVEGYKYVNGVLDKLAAQVRAVEVAARR